MNDWQQSKGDTTVALESLLSQLKRGENLQAVKEQLVSRAYSRLRIIARKMLSSYDRNELDEETDGLVAEAYLRINRSLDQLCPETVRQFLALSALQMRRHLLDKLRRIHGRGVERRPRVASLDTNSASNDKAPLQIADGESISAWTAIDILEALERLEERERECLVMQHWYGFTHQEIAELINVSTKTVQRTCNLAFLKLNEMLQSYGEGSAE